MNTRKNQILSLLIVGVLATIAIGATQASAAIIPVGIRARMHHPTLATPINLGGVGNINVDIVAGTVMPDTFNLVDATGGPALAQISWSTGTVDSFGRFRVVGQAYGQWVDGTGVTRYVHFRMVIRGRTNNAGTHVRAMFRETAGTPGARLRGGCRG